MSKVYISGPMSGHPELNFPAFHAKAAELRAQGRDVVNPAEIPQPDPTSWHECMKADLKQMMDCDTIHMLQGWRHSDGAKMELALAVALNFTVEYA